MATATRENIIDGACTIIVDAYEGCSAYWAVANGTYQWANDGRMYELGNKGTHASVTLYKEDECDTVDETDPDYGNLDKGFFTTWGNEFVKFGTPYYLDHNLVADLIVKVGTGQFSQDTVPDYGQLGKRAIHTMRAIYFGDDDAFDDYDAYTADSIIQFALFGEVIYG
jgi:hypothetical protein